MDTYSKVNNLLCERAGVNEKKIENKSYKVKDLTCMTIRDVLYAIGEITYENINENMYFALLSGGFLNKNTVYTAVELKHGVLNIALYADEGIIKQHTCEDALNEIEKNINKYICNN